MEKFKKYVTWKNVIIVLINPIGLVAVWWIYKKSKQENK